MTMKAAMVPYQAESSAWCNVGRTERWLTGIAGAALAAYGASEVMKGLRRRGDEVAVESAVERSDAAVESAPERPAGEAVRELAGAKAAEASTIGEAAMTSVREGKVPALMMLAGGGIVLRAVSGFCPVYAAIGRGSADATADWEPKTDTASTRALSGNRGIRVRESITIDRPRGDIYAFWRNFENLPRFMRHLKEVAHTGGGRSHWVVSGPAGATVEWDAEIINEEPNRVIGWRTLPGADVVSAGSVHFEDAPAGGTTIDVRLQYQPPAGIVGATLERLLGNDPAQQIREDLSRLKSTLEARDLPRTGESARVWGQV